MKISMLKTRFGIGLLSLGFIFFTKNIGHAQDLHYSQFYNSPLNVNPGLTGVYNGDKRILTSYRNQWSSVPVPWTTYSLSYDQKLYSKNQDRFFFNVGGLLNYDRQGDSNISLSNLNAVFSVSQVTNPATVISLGAMIGYSSRAFDSASLRWDSQWNGDTFDPNLPGEIFNADMVDFLETAFGVNVRFQRSKRTKIDVGAAAFHILQPKIAFLTTDDIELPRRFTGTADGSLQLNNKIDLLGKGLFQLQQDYQETVLSGLLKYYLSRKRGNEVNLYVGGGYRFSGSVFPIFALDFNQVNVSLSYDIDISDATVKTDGRGGPEIHFRYIIKSVKPLGQFKVCPIY